MKTHALYAVLALALASGVATAFDATQFDIPASTRTREEVRAELEQAKRDHTLMSGGEATVFVDRPVAEADRRRDEVRDEARDRAARRPADELSTGSF